MGILDKFKSKAVAARQLEERLYTKVEQEMATGRRNEALWLMALEQAEYDTEKQLASYITLRIQALRDEAYREGGFDKFKSNAVAIRKSEEKLYERVAEEMNGGHQNRALWLKALKQAGGNTDKQPFKYIKLRVQSLRDEAHTLGRIEREISKKALTLGSDTSDADTLIDSIRDDVSVVELKSLFSGYSENQLKMLVNKKDASEELPLHLALKKDRMDVAEWLLALGANTDARNYWGKTAKEIARLKDSGETLKLVLRYASLS